MQTRSRYSRLIDLTRSVGLAVLLAATAFPWLSTSTAPSWTYALGLWAASLFVGCLAKADTGNLLVRIAMAALPVAGGIVVIAGIFVSSSILDWAPIGVTVAASSFVAIRWNSDSERPENRQTRVVVLAAVSGLGCLFASFRWTITLGFGLWFLVGSLLYLWDYESQETGGVSSYFRAVGGAVFLVALGFFAVLPAVVAVSLSLLSLVLGWAVDALLFFLRPVGLILERLMDWIMAALAAREQIRLPEIAEGIPEELLQTPTDSGLPIFVRILGVALAIAVAWLLVRAVWRAIGAAGERRVDRQSRERQNLGDDAMGWMIQKGKDLIVDAIGAIQGMLPRAKAQDPLVRLYNEFLGAVEKAGYPRGVGQTPLEFAAVLEAALPEASQTVSIISSGFSAGFYGRTPPNKAQIAGMQKALADLRTTLKRKGLPS